MSHLSLPFVHFLLTRLYLDGVCEIYNFIFCMYTYIIVIYQNVYDEFDVINDNKRPMGHIAHLRKQFKSLNKYNLIITLIKRRKKKLYEKLLVLHLQKFESPSPKDALCQVWLKLAQWFWLRGFFNFINVFWLFQNYLPLEKGRALHLNKLKSPSPKDALCQVWLKLDQVFLEKKIF